MMPPVIAEPTERNSVGTPEPVWTICSCQTLAKPSTMKLMPRVMINGWTRNTPIPTPLTKPARAAARSATTIDEPESWAADERGNDETRHGSDRLRPTGRCRR